MKRTIKQYTTQLNRHQLKIWNQTVIPYNQQVDAFLVQFSHLKYVTQVTNQKGRTKIRDNMVKSQFKSPFGLQARQWKMALLDSLETITKQWESAISKIKTDYLYRHEELNDDERHYANWLLYKTKKGCIYERIIAIIKNRDITDKQINLDSKGRKKVRHYLKRCFGKVMKKRPRVKIMRRISCDPQLYRVRFDKEKQCQVLGITTTQPRKELFVDLKGINQQKGNAKIIYDFTKNRLELHQTRDIKKKPLGNTISACDYGMSEVITDENGHQYGSDLWRRLSKQNEYLLQKGKRRNKLFQLMEKTQDVNKKRHFQQMLQSKNRDKQHHKHQKSVENEINQAYRQYFTSRQIRTCGFEDISGMSGKTKYKGLSRMVSLWV